MTNKNIRYEDMSRAELLAHIEELNARISETESLRGEFDKTAMELIAAARAFEEEKVRIDGIMAALGDGISVQDRDFKVLYQNDAHRQMVGGSKIGLSCYKEYAHEDRICDGCPVALCFQDGDVHVLQKSVTDSPAPMFIEIKASPLKDAEGNVVAAIELVRDITSRKLAEMALAVSEDRYRSLFESAGDAIFVLGLEGAQAGSIIAANRAAAEMHGYTVEELTGMKITDLDAEDAAREAPARIARIMQGHWVKAEITHRRKDGSEFPVEITAGPLEVGGQKFILAFDRDISERKIAEHEKELLIGQLRTALQNIKTLRGLLPICAWCKKVRDDQGYWKGVEDYIEEHSDAMFTHGICPDCLKKNDPDLYDKLCKP